MTTKAKKNSASLVATGKGSPQRQLIAAFEHLQGNPMGGLLLEDLAAAREHGSETARIGIGPDGNPIIYARSEALADRLGKAVQQQTTVHVRHLPDLDKQQFELLAAQATSALPAPAPAASRGRKLVLDGTHIPVPPPDPHSVAKAYDKLKYRYTVESDGEIDACGTLQEAFENALEIAKASGEEVFVKQDGVTMRRYFTRAGRVVHADVLNAKPGASNTGFWWGLSAP